MPFPHYTQLDAMDCGPTALRIIAQYYGKHYSLQSLREKCHIAVAMMKTAVTEHPSISKSPTEM